MLNKNQFFVLAGTCFLLLIPLIGMQFTNEVNWSVFDFILMGALLLGLGFTSEFIFRKITHKTYKLGLIVLLVIVFLLIWVELAVGLFNSPFAGS
ncbi:hypothetical protein [Flavobacterium sp. H122]|uniref:hypothetical protein n=1 Tax=Flavobacterium sp. H122 TaxID=2529860 RepID=UPI0010AAA26A|nr:hypothetical protein [Flavobacterium sp. H122]